MLTYSTEDELINDQKVAYIVSLLKDSMLRIFGPCVPTVHQA